MTPIDRVARAIDAAIEGQGGWDDGYCDMAAVARAAIEALRDVPDLCYDGYRCDKTWRELNSKEVWNLWLDAALKEETRGK